jgi:hypothetical protein
VDKKVVFIKYNYHIYSYISIAIPRLFIHY